VHHATVAIPFQGTVAHIAQLSLFSRAGNRSPLLNRATTRRLNTLWTTNVHTNYKAARALLFHLTSASETEGTSCSLQLQPTEVHHQASASVYSAASRIGEASSDSAQLSEEDVYTAPPT
jgi:hypothetical protein